MDDRFPFDEFEDHLDDREEFAPVACTVCQAMLPEALDGGLNAAAQVALDRHVAGCSECARELAEAQRGAAWLTLLKSQAPEPPARLLSRILAETTLTGTPAVRPAAAAAPPTLIPRPVWSAPLAPVWHQHLRRRLQASLTGSRSNLFSGFALLAQPRLAMTAAMAFFSIALTLNLSGVRLQDLRAQDFTPGGVQRTLADAGASLTRSFQNSRVVYQVESRVSELRSDDGLRR